MNGFLEDIGYNEYFDTTTFYEVEIPPEEEAFDDDTNLIIEWMNSNSNKTFDEWYHDKSLRQNQSNQ